MRMFLRKRLPALMLAILLLLGLLPAAAAASADITLKVSAGKAVELDEDDFAEFFTDSYTKGTFQYVTFEPAKNYIAAAGYIYCNYDSSSEKIFKSDLEDYEYYYTGNSSLGKYPLSKLSFVAAKSAETQTVTIDFEVNGLDKNGRERSVDGTMEIKITGSSTASAVKDDTITYKIVAGGEVEFDADDFDEVFHNYQSSKYDLLYVIFDNPSSSNYSGGKVYANYGKKTSESFSRMDFGDDVSFYYDDSKNGDWALDDLSFVADKDFERDVVLTFTAIGSSKKEVEGTLVITLKSGSSSSSSSTTDDEDDGDISYTVAPGKTVTFDEDDFEEYYSDHKTGNLTYVEFTAITNLSSSTGVIYYRYDRSGEEKFTATSLKKYAFYCGNYDDDGDYPLDDLSFVAASGFDSTVTLEFRAYSSSSKYVDGVLTITSTKAPKKGDIDYTTPPNANVPVKAEDFKSFYKEEGPGGTFSYIKFLSSSDTSSIKGLFLVKQGTSEEKFLSWSALTSCTFYDSVSDFDQLGSNSYAIGDLVFSAGKEFDAVATLKFRAYASSSKYVDGTLTFTPGSGSSSGTTSTTADSGAYIYYSTTYSTNLQLNPNDFNQFLQKTYPSATLQSVRFSGAPATGELYYNYYNASTYGGVNRTLLSASSVSTPLFYFNPTSTSQYSLNELTFVPKVQKANYCESIPFTAYSTGGQSVSGSVLISVTLMQVADVYGAVTKNTTVTFPVTSFYSVLLSATGVTFDSIRLLELPAASAGVIYVGSAATTKADTATRYTYAAGSGSVSQLRFVPKSGFTGSVEVPYMAYDASGAAIATGKFCFGIVNTLKKFSDVTSSTWCYKYVTELSDASVIEGYSDGTFRPNNSVSWGAALKLVMLAAGYAEQAPTSSSSVFSGYLDKARADGLVTGTIDLGKAITRLQVAQLAAKALKLSIANLPSQKPFTDTSDPYLQALNATGIVGGYFNNGTYTYKPTNTLTRGQLSAIVWRMQQYRS